MSQTILCSRCESVQCSKYKKRFKSPPKGSSLSQTPYATSSDSLVCPKCYSAITRENSRKKNLLKPQELNFLSDDPPDLAEQQRARGRPAKPLGEGHSKTIERQFETEFAKSQGIITKERGRHWKINFSSNNNSFELLMSIETGDYLISRQKSFVMTPHQFGLAEDFHRATPINVGSIISQIDHKIQSSALCNARFTYFKTLNQKNIAIGRGKVFSHEHFQKGGTKFGMIVGKEGKGVFWRSSQCTAFLSQSDFQGGSCLACTSDREFLYSTRLSNRHAVLLSDDDRKPFFLTVAKDAQLLSGFMETAKSNSILANYVQNLMKNQTGSIRWSAPVLSWAIHIYVHAGTAGYNALRQTKESDGLPLPHISTLQKKISHVKKNPGIDQVACSLFRKRLQKLGKNDAILSFDEIYIVSGIRMVRCKEGYSMIGVQTPDGCYDLTRAYLIDEALQLEEPAIISGSPNENCNDSIPQLYNQVGSSDALFMIPVEAAALLRGNNDQWKKRCLWQDASCSTSGMIKMALHFFLSSSVTNLASAIGYFEITSIKASDLQYFINEAILGALGKSRAELVTAENEFLQTNQGQIKKSNGCYHLPENRSDSLRIIALCFDGSTHARNFALDYGGSVLKYDKKNFCGKRIPIADLKIVGFEHPCQSTPIICLGDVVHLLKRCRNSVIKKKPCLFFAPSCAEILASYQMIKDRVIAGEDVSNLLTDFWRINSARVGLSIYEEILNAEVDRPLSLSRLTLDCINLTSRSKMSYPLAKRALSERVIYALRSLPCPIGEDEEQKQKSLQVRCNLEKYLLLLQPLFLLRQTIQPSNDEIETSLTHFIINMDNWRTRNIIYNQKLIEIDKLLNIPSRFKTAKNIFGFWNREIYCDIKLTLGGLKSLLHLNIWTKLFTTDVLESFFSTMRRGKGALTVEAHRNAYRKSKLVRLGDRVSYLSAIQLRESTITIEVLLKYYLKNKSQLKPQPISGEPPFDTISEEEFSEFCSSRTEQECLLDDHISGWLLAKLLKKYENTNAFEILLSFKKQPAPENSENSLPSSSSSSTSSITTERLNSVSSTHANISFKNFCMKMLLFCQKMLIFYPKFYLHKKFHCFMTGCASKICGNDWPLPKSCDLRENILTDAIRRYTAMYISDKLRHSDIGSTRGNLPMRVEVLIKKRDSGPATQKRARIGQSSETCRRASKRHSFRDHN
jgi:hypothetical protein